VVGSKRREDEEEPAERSATEERLKRPKRREVFFLPTSMRGERAREEGAVTDAAEEEEGGAKRRVDRGRDGAATGAVSAAGEEAAMDEGSAGTGGTSSSLCECIDGLSTSEKERLRGRGEERGLLDSA
jgi:hypothetical protein